MDYDERLSEIHRLRFQEGKTLRAIAEIVGISHQRIGQLLGRTGHAQAEYRENFAREHLRMTNDEIAEELGITPNHVSTYRNDLHYRIKGGYPRKGQEAEEWVADQIRTHAGVGCAHMHQSCGYDINLANGTRIEVKSTATDVGYYKFHSIRFEKSAWRFSNIGRNKADIFVCVIVPHDAALVLPKSALPKKSNTIIIPYPDGRSKYHEFINRWDIIRDASR